MTGAIARVPLLLALAAVPAAAEKSLCTAGETVVFTCPAANRLVSVCASPDVSPTSGYVAYRFGPEGHPDISYQERNMTRAGTWTFSGGGGAWLRFNRDAVSYVVYTAIGRGWGEKAGVSVIRDGKPVSNIPCRGKPLSLIGPDFFARAGIRDDTTDFDLP